MCLNVFIDFFLYFSPLLALVHIQHCAHNDAKLQRGKFSPFKWVEWLIKIIWRLVVINKAKSLV